MSSHQRRSVRRESRPLYHDDRYARRREHSRPPAQSQAHSDVQVVPRYTSSRPALQTDQPRAGSYETRSPHEGRRGSNRPLSPSEQTLAEEDNGGAHRHQRQLPRSGQPVNLPIETPASLMSADGHGLYAQTPSSENARLLNAGEMTAPRTAQADSMMTETNERFDTLSLQHETSSTRLSTTKVASPVTRPASSTQYPLSEVAAEFVKIALGDFRACMKHVLRFPSILKEGQNTFQAAAILAYKSNDDKLGNQIVERLVIIHHCQRDHLSTEQSCQYIDSLQSSKTKYKKFQDHYETIRKAFKRSAASHQPTVSNVAAAQPHHPTTKNAPPARMHAAGYQGAPNLSDESSANLPAQQNSTDSMMTTHEPLSGSRTHSLSHAGTGTGLTQYDFQRGMRPMGVNSQYSQTNYTQTPATSTQPFLAGANNPYMNNLDGPVEPQVPYYYPTATGTGPGSQYQHQQQQPHSFSATRRTGYGSAPSAYSRGGGDDELEDDGQTLPSLVHMSKAEFKATDTEQGRKPEGQYAPRQNDAKNFFGRGRVFRMWWHEPAGRHADPSSYSISNGPQGSRVHSKLIWMVVIQNKKGYSICCPMSTYKGKGLRKPGLDPRECRAHAIIFSEGQKPYRLSQEPETTKSPIKVKGNAATEPINPAARVHFGKSHTVQWDVSVMDMGRVVAEHRELLSHYYAMEHTA